MNLQTRSSSPHLAVPGWVVRYRRADLRHDVVAGVTVAAMLVPQAMAYALLAGLPPTVGLAAATFPLIAYALIGTSRQLAVGPVAIVSLLTASALAPLVEQGTVGYVSAAGLLALMVGVVHLALGIFRLGFVVDFLSHAVLVGFTAAAAIVIGLSQAKHLLGVSMPRADNVVGTARELARAIGDTHLVTLLIGAGSVLALLVLRRYLRAVPGALVVVTLSTVAVAIFDLDERGVATVGTIPASLPAFGLPTFDGGIIRSLATTAVIITLVGFMESMAVAKVYARRTRHEIDPDSELIGLGMSNVTAGVFGGYPVTGGFSRTAVNAGAGARTQLASIVTALLVMLTLAVLTPLFSSLPQAALGAIIVVAVINLVDVAEMRHIARVKRSDLVTLATAFIATLVLGIELGIAVAIVVSMLVVFARSSRPHIAVLGRIPGTTSYRNVDRFGDAHTTPGVAALRIDAPLSFVNAAAVKRAVLAEAESLEADPVNGRCVVLDCSAVGDLDATGAATLDDLLADLDDRQIVLRLADVKGPVRDVLHRSGLWERLPDRIHATTHDAVTSAAGVRSDPALSACLDDRLFTGLPSSAGNTNGRGDVWNEMVRAHENFVGSHCDGTVPSHRPRAAVLACSDARVPPTVLFGREPGDLFVVRLAGNVASAEAIASLTFATEHLGADHVIVLGHSGCGAVDAALRSRSDDSLGPIVEPLRSLMAMCDTCTTIDDVVRANVAHSLSMLISDLGDLGRAIRCGSVTLHGAVHDLRTGRLDEIDAADTPTTTPAASQQHPNLPED